MSSTIRLAFAGASGTGKSTLAEHVASRYRLPLCPVGARSVAASMGFASPYDVDKAGKREEFQRRLFEEKRAWEAAHDAFVTDRTHLDNLAYRALGGACTALDETELREYLTACERYTEIVYVPLQHGQWLGDDHARLQASGYHWLYDVLLRGLLERVDYVHRATLPGRSALARTTRGRTAWLESFLGPPPV